MWDEFQIYYLFESFFPDRPLHPVTEHRRRIDHKLNYKTGNSDGDISITKLKPTFA